MCGGWREREDEDEEGRKSLVSDFVFDSRIIM